MAKNTLSSFDELAKKILVTLGGVLLVYLIVYLGFLSQKVIVETAYVGKAERQEHTLRVDAVGEADVRPNLAVITMGSNIEADTVEEAQNENTQKMNQLSEQLVSLGVEKKDIQTQNYNVYPVYDYSSENGRELTGYSVSQNVEVRVHDVDMSGEVLALAGKLGLNQVGGIRFEIDDKEAFLADARVEAMKKIQEKVRHIEKQLGVRVVGVVDYEEYQQSSGEVPMYARAFAEDSGLGGAAPQIEAGQDTVSLQVRMTLEIK